MRLPSDKKNWDSQCPKWGKSYTNIKTKHEKSNNTPTRAPRKEQEIMVMISRIINQGSRAPVINNCIVLLANLFCGSVHAGLWRSGAGGVYLVRHRANILSKGKGAFNCARKEVMVCRNGILCFNYWLCWFERQRPISEKFI